MLRLGLTGGIGAGKSTVARRLAERGAVVIDADRLAREVVDPGSDGLAAVVEVFGRGILAPDGAVDRAALGALVFGDGEARLRLNGLLHPRIATLTAQRLAELPPDAIVVHDVPLLIENRMGADYHLVLVVHASVEERVRRLVADRGMSEDDARARIAAQADEATRRAAADVWLDNSGPVDAVEAQVDRLWADRVTPFAENVLTGRAAPRPHNVPTVDPDPGWADAGRRLAARIRRAAGECVVRVDHVGPTAVPGRPAPDVVELQLVVADLEAMDAVRADVEGAGFVRDDGRSRDLTWEGVEEDARLHRSADPGRAADVHMRSAQGQGWREALLLRDWLHARGTEVSADDAPTSAGEWAKATRWVPDEPGE